MRVMRRFVASALLLAVLAPLVVVVVGAANPVSGQQPTVTGIDTLRSCLAINRRLDAVLVVDETVSLTNTDPEGARVGALQAVVDAVALAVRGTPQGDSPISASLLIAGFGMEYSPTPEGWIDVNPASLPTLKEIAQGFGDRNKIVGTNYVAALQGAQDSLDQRAAESGAATPSCRLVVLFSDGQYAFGPQPSGSSVGYAPDLDLGDPGQKRQALEAGLKTMCDSGGLLDRMRTTSPPTVLIGLGLKLSAETNDDSELPVSPLALFTALATGTGQDGTTCGNPNSAAFGAVTTADEVASLGIGIFCSLNGCAPAPPGAAGQPITVTVDPGVTALVIQAAGTTPFVFRITDPTGASISAPSATPGATSGLAADVIVEPQSDKFSVARISLGSGSVGDWTIEALVDGDPAGSAVALGVSRQSGLSLGSEADLRATIGEPAQFDAQLQAPDGSPIGTQQLNGSYEISARLNEPRSFVQLAEIEATVDPRSGEVNLQIGEVPETTLTNLYLEVTLNGAYADGQQRQPVVLTRSVALLRGGLPLVTAPASGVRLSGVRGGTDNPTALGSVAVEADEGVAGRACVVGYEQAVPTDGVPALLANVVDPCVDVPSGEKVDLSIALAVSEVQSGEYSGSVLVELTAPNDSRVNPATVRVPVGFAGYAPLCTGVLVRTIVAIVGLAALLVIAILFLLSRLAARFPREGTTIAFAAVPVSINGEQLSVGDGEPFGISLQDFAGLLVAEDAKGQSLSVGDTGATITPRPRWFGMPQARVHYPGSVVIGCEDGVLQRGRLGRTGLIRHELAGSWALTLDTAKIDDDATDGKQKISASGTLWVMREALADNRGLFDLADRVRREVVGPTVQAVARRMAERGVPSERRSLGAVVGKLRRSGGGAEDPVTPDEYQPSGPPGL